MDSCPAADAGPADMFYVGYTTLNALSSPGVKLRIGNSYSYMWQTNLASTVR